MAHEIDGYKPPTTLNDLRVRKGKGTIKDRALSELEPAAIQILREGLASDDEAQRLKVAMKILDWKWGRPTVATTAQTEEREQFSSSVLDVLTAKNN